MSENKNIKKFISLPVIQTLLIYLSSGWLILEMTDYFISHYDLTARFRDIMLIIMIIGLPIALFLTWIFSREKPKEEEKGVGVFKILLKRLWFTIPAVVVIGLLIFSAVRYVYQHNTEDAAFPNISAAMQLPEVSLAVLPFTSFTGNPDQDWVIAGQHESLIHELSKVSRFRPLRIISRSTVDAFKNYDKPIAEIAREIDVDYLVETSVLASEDSVTLQLRLIHLDPEENVVWAETLSSDYMHILGFYSSLANQIARRVNLALSPDEEEKLGIKREINPDCYKAYLRGMYNLNLLTPEGMEKGLEYLHEAVRIDPAEPFAHAGLALGYLELAHSPLDPGDALTKAEAAASKAFKLDTTMAEIYTALGEVYLYELWKFDLAREYLEKALRINPNLAITHYHFAWALYLFGDTEGALREHNLARKYDPFNALNTAYMGVLYYSDGQMEKAIEIALESFEIEEDYPAGYFVLGMAYLQAGMPEDAIETHQKMIELYPWWSWGLGYTYAVTGHTAEAEEIVKQLESVDPNNWNAVGLAWVYNGLGRMDEAFKWLNYEPHHAFTAWAAVQPEFKELWKDPRFEEFLGRLNLPE
ncbi:MAG: tetratricopeptide repeat protein [Bacteroidia bacterium]|nr:MAG: tetratricopeptide repeat protein [Bacteroidia bacterium]